MSELPRRRPGCIRTLIRGVLALVAIVGAILAWDVWQLRTLRPPDDRTLQGFIDAGREGSLLLDEKKGRLYWVAPPAPTVVSYSEPPVYAFDRSGKLIDWTPGTEDLKGMFLGEPVRRSGRPATVEEARAWIQIR